VQSFVSQYEKYYGLSVLIAVVSALTILVIAADECRVCFNKLEEANQVATSDGHKTYWVYGKNVESGHLRHVFEVLGRLGYKNDPNATDWDLLWAHDYPFRKLYPRLNDLRPHQRVNHFPGCGYITNKVDLAVTRLRHIPPAFKLPQDKQDFLAYAAQHPNVSFVQKNNDHRNIKVKAVAEIDLDSEGTFVQEFIDKPLLVSGHKFDIGIYTVITSIDPLRVYIYNGDVLLRWFLLLILRPRVTVSFQVLPRQILPLRPPKPRQIRGGGRLPPHMGSPCSELLLRRARLRDARESQRFSPLQRTRPPKNLEPDRGLHQDLDPQQGTQDRRRRQQVTATRGRSLFRNPDKCVAGLSRSATFSN
jgi:hypothetical protein